MSADFVFVAGDPEQKKRFLKVFGDDSVAVVSFVPQRVDLPGLEGELVYFLDLAELTPGQKTALVRDICERFQMPVDEVAANLEMMGVPVRAEGGTMVIRNPAVWLE